MATLPTDLEYGLQIRPAENGYLVMHNSNFYVFITLKAALKFIEEAFKNDKN